MADEVNASKTYVDGLVGEVSNYNYTKLDKKIDNLPSYKDINTIADRHIKEVWGDYFNTSALKYYRSVSLNSYIKTEDAWASDPSAGIYYKPQGTSITFYPSYLPLFGLGTPTHIIMSVKTGLKTYEPYIDDSKIMTDGRIQYTWKYDTIEEAEMDSVQETAYHLIYTYYHGSSTTPYKTFSYKCINLYSSSCSFSHTAIADPTDEGVIYNGEYLPKLTVSGLNKIFDIDISAHYAY